MRLLFLIVSLGLSLACGPSANNGKPNANNTAAKTPQAALPVYGYEVVKAYPHDPTAFTEGLFFHDGFLYESTGGDKAGASTIQAKHRLTQSIILTISKYLKLLKIFTTENLWQRMTPKHFQSLTA